MDLVLVQYGDRAGLGLDVSDFSHQGQIDLGAGVRVAEKVPSAP
jgi:hypothetical protein